MARVNVEGKALTDPRVKRLARHLGTDLPGALGRLVLVWHACVELGEYILPDADIDAAADDTPGMAAAMVESGLARREDAGVYVCGTEGRIEWLQRRRGAARKGGTRTAEKAARAIDGTFSKQTPSTCLDESKQTSKHGVVPLSSPLTPALTPTLTQEQKQMSMSGEAPDALLLFPQGPPPESKAEAARREEGAFLEWFNRHFGRAFSGSETVQGQVKSLLSRGYTQDDMRDVAWLLKGKWEGEPKMAPHLVPQTILRVTSFGARLDEARQAYRRRSDG